MSTVSFNRVCRSTPKMKPKNAELSTTSLKLPPIISECDILVKQSDIVTVHHRTGIPVLHGIQATSIDIYLSTLNKFM
jgi:hypothetical protein